MKLWDFSPDTNLSDVMPGSLETMVENSGHDNERKKFSQEYSFRYLSNPRWLCDKQTPHQPGCTNKLLVWIVAI